MYEHILITVVPSGVVLTRNMSYSILYCTMVQHNCEFPCSHFAAAFPVAKIASLTDLLLLLLLFNLFLLRTDYLYTDSVCVKFVRYNKNFAFLLTTKIIPDIMCVYVYNLSLC